MPRERPLPGPSHWKNQYAGGATATLSKAKLTDVTGAFWIADANTYEYLIRFNTATKNGRIWIAIPTFTDVEFWVDVTDNVDRPEQGVPQRAGEPDAHLRPFLFPLSVDVGGPPEGRSVTRRGRRISSWGSPSGAVESCGRDFRTRPCRSETAHGTGKPRPGRSASYRVAPSTLRGAIRAGDVERGPAPEPVRVGSPMHARSAR